MINKLSRTNFRSRDKFIFVFPFTVSYQVQSKIEIPLWKEQLKERDNDYYSNSICSYALRHFT